MRDFDLIGTASSKRTCSPAKAPTVISHQHARQGPDGRRPLYVPAFGLAGAMLANTLVFLYFASFHGTG